MDPFQFFGDLLSERINKPPIACRGLIRFSLKDTGHSADNPSYNSLLKAFKEGLNVRLKNIGIEKSDSVVNEMITELKKNQSLLTIGMA